MFFISHNEYIFLWRKGLTQTYPGPTLPEDASPIETQQNKDISGSSTANFQHSEEEEIIIEQSETQTLDACKLSMLVDLANVLSAMLVDLANVLSDIKPSKELGYDEIYQFYKNHFVPATNDQLAHTSVTKKCSTYKLYFKTN